jgi:hypothetical protein
MSGVNLRQIDEQLTRLRARRAKEISDRIDELTALRRRIDDEILILAAEGETIDDGTGTRRSRHVVPDCGTESGYQRHRHRGEDCEPCKAAHATHERVKAARRRLRQIAGSGRAAS